MNSLLIVIIDYDKYVLYNFNCEVFAFTCTVVNVTIYIPVHAYILSIYVQSNASKKQQRAVDSYIHICCIYSASYKFIYNTHRMQVNQVY